MPARIYRAAFKKPEDDEIVWISVKASNTSSAMRRAREIVKKRYNGKRLRVVEAAQEMR